MLWRLGEGGGILQEVVTLAPTKVEGLSLATCAS